MTPPADARACRRCGCTELDCRGCVERTGAPCRWILPDVCSACAVLEDYVAAVSAVVPRLRLPEHAQRELATTCARLEAQPADIVQGARMLGLHPTRFAESIEAAANGDEGPCLGC